MPIASNTETFGPGQQTPPREGVAREIENQGEDVRNLLSLSGGAVLVTGGARGLGLCIASAIIEAGADVYCSDIVDEPSKAEWSALAAKSKGLGRRIEYAGGINICNGKQVNELYAGIASRRAQAGLGPITGLLHAAATQHEQDAIDYDMEPFARVMRINVDGSMVVAQAAARVMRQSGVGGSIVLIASMSGFIANRGLHCAAYQPSKAAVHQLARSLAVEWAVYRIRVNTLSPGYVRTAMSNMLLAEHPDKLKLWESSNPLSRIALPYELKAPAVFLLSSGSSFMTGADLKIDGGVSVRRRRGRGCR